VTTSATDERFMALFVGYSVVVTVWQIMTSSLSVTSLIHSVDKYAEVPEDSGGRDEAMTAATNVDNTLLTRELRSSLRLTGGGSNTSTQQH